MGLAEVREKDKGRSGKNKDGQEPGSQRESREGALCSKDLCSWQDRGEEVTY